MEPSLKQTLSIEDYVRIIAERSFRTGAKHLPRNRL